jgi:hypothetical protein
MIANHSKLIGSLVGAGFGYAVAKLGLPAEFATPEIQMGITGLFAAIATWIFPANKAN